jgi:competence ComEA-like helix-hairpin-helix protein
MSEAEIRALIRGAVLLLAASTLRWGWATARSVPAVSGVDALPEVLEISRERVDERAARERPLGPSERLDPNRATAVELDRMPGVGAATAKAIVDARTEDGPFVVLEDLLEVRGIGPATLERVRPHLDFASPAAKPRSSRVRWEVRGTALIDVNRADEAALQELSGVGPALARRIVEARQNRPFRSIDDLVRVRGIGPATLSRLRSQVTIRP